MRPYPVSPALIGVLGYLVLSDAWSANEWGKFAFLAAGFAHQGYLFWRTDKDIDG